VNRQHTIMHVEIKKIGVKYIIRVRFGRFHDPHIQKYMLGLKRQCEIPIVFENAGYNQSDNYHELVCSYNILFKIHVKRIAQSSHLLSINIYQNGCNNAIMINVYGQKMTALFRNP